MLGSASYPLCQRMAMNEDEDMSVNLLGGRLSEKPLVIDRASELNGELEP